MSVIGVGSTAEQETAHFALIKHHDEMERFITRPVDEQQATLSKLVRLARQQERNPTVGPVITAHTRSIPSFGVERALAWPNPTQLRDDLSSLSDAEGEKMPLAGPSGVMRPADSPKKTVPDRIKASGVLARASYGVIRRPKMQDIDSDGRSGEEENSDTGEASEVAANGEKDHAEEEDAAEEEEASNSEEEPADSDIAGADADRQAADAEDEMDAGEDADAEGKIDGEEDDAEREVDAEGEDADAEGEMDAGKDTDAKSQVDADGEDNAAREADAEREDPDLECEVGAEEDDAAREVDAEGEDADAEGEVDAGEDTDAESKIDAQGEENAARKVVAEGDNADAAHEVDAEGEDARTEREVDPSENAPVATDVTSGQADMDGSVDLARVNGEQGTANAVESVPDTSHRHSISQRRHREDEHELGGAEHHDGISQASIACKVIIRGTDYGSVLVPCTPEVDSHSDAAIVGSTLRATAGSDAQQYAPVAGSSRVERIKHAIRAGMKRQHFTSAMRGAQDHKDEGMNKRRKRHRHGTVVERAIYGQF